MKSKSSSIRTLHNVALYIIPIIFIGLVGCSPIVKNDQAQHNTEIQLESESSIGQTFLASYDGFSGISLFLKPGEHHGGDIVLNIHAEPEISTIQSVSIPLNTITEAGYYKFSFPQLSDTSHQDYYFEVNVEGEGDVLVGVGPGNNYQNGSAYSNKFPINKQIAFRLTYEPGLLLIGLGIELLKWAGYILACIFLFVVPGWAFLLWLFPSWEKISWSERLALASGTSLALYPIILLWSNLIGLSLGQLYAWLLPVAGLVFIFWKQRKNLITRRSHSAEEGALDEVVSRGKTNGKRVQSFLRDHLPEIALFFLLGLILIVRYWNIRLLDAPLWGDSYQHSMIAQLLVENQGIPSTWLPYVPYQSLTVHFGFPVSVALLQWLVDIPNTIATLYIGQVLNVIAAFSLYPLAVRMSGGNRWAGVGAVLFAGLLSPTPAFYTNWGRYAQLAGQAILPIALWFFWDALVDHPDRSIDGIKNAPKKSSSIQQALFTHDNFRKLLISGTVIAGMTLNYYRMPFFFGTFVLAWLITWGFKYWRGDLRQWGYSIFRIIAMISISILLFLPWGFRLSGGVLIGAIEAGITGGSPLQAILQDFQSWKDFSLYVPNLVLILVFAASLLSLIIKRNLFITLFLWFLFLVAFKAGQLIRLPGANMIQNFAVIIALYIPISILLGWLFGTIIDFIIQFNKNIGQITAGSVIVILGIWGALDQRNIVDGDRFALVTKPDMKAMQWIGDNTHQDARFLVEGFRIYNGTSAVGSDAGWWISLLTGRQNTMPPQYALLSEIPVSPNYSKDVVTLVAGLETTSLDSENGLNLLCEHDITHIYIGQGQGEVGYGATQLFSPDMLAEYQAYQLIYRHDRIYIYEIDPQYCLEN